MDKVFIYYAKDHTKPPVFTEKNAVFLGLFKIIT